MCLTPIHKNTLIATQDIRCYKWLIKRGSFLLTPFKDELIVFKNGIAVQETDNFSYDAFGDICKGIHSLQKRINRINRIYGRCHYSIIPKGTQYYVGDANNLVSLKLIIFKNKFRYWIYKIFHK